MQRILLLLVVFFNLLLLASAQSDKAELFGGYSLEHIAPGCGSNYRCPTNAGPAVTMNGWTALLTGFVWKSLGISAQLTGNYGRAKPSDTGVHRYGYQFGPAYTVRWERASVFAHFLIGGISQTSADQTLSYRRFMWSVGGGLDVKTLRRISIRPVQLDYERQSVPIVDTGGPTPFSPVGVNGLRYSAGIVLRF